MVEAHSKTAPSGALREVGGNMGETLSLFGDEQLAGDAASEVKVAFADRVEFRSVEDAASLFDGFRTMKAITWSYGLGMVVRQMRRFEHVELVFGCADMLEDNVKLSALATLVQQAEAIKALQSKAGREISERVEDGTCELFFENTARSHQKLYLLADEGAGAFRVLTGSANLSSAAWSGDKQKEVIVCFEGKGAYDSFLDQVYEPFKRTCAERVADLAEVRGAVRKAYLAKAVVKSEVVTPKPAEPTKFEQYYDYSEPLSAIPSHRFLAIRRGQKEGVLWVRLAIDQEELARDVRELAAKYLPAEDSEDFALACADAVKRLLAPSCEIDVMVEKKLEADRAAVLAALESVDLVVVFTDKVPLKVIAKARPDVYVKGGDYRVEDLPEARLVATWGARTVTVAFEHDRSTTALLRKVRG